MAKKIFLYKCANVFGISKCGDMQKRKLIVRFILCLFFAVLCCVCHLAYTKTRRKDADIKNYFKRKLSLKSFSFAPPMSYETKKLAKRNHFFPGYVTFDEKNLLELHCKDCSLVFGSGLLLNENRGFEIDKRSCVFRTNDAPTAVYSAKVGFKTTVRMLSHSSDEDVYNLLLKDYDHEIANTKFVVWGHPNEMIADAKTPKVMQKMKFVWPELQLYKLTDDNVYYAYKTLEKEAGIDMKMNYCSTGWFTVLLAMEACDSLHFYGMVDEAYCKNETRIKASYHYYLETYDECYSFDFHANQPSNVHRYYEEKRTIKKWANLQGAKMFFHVPKWTGVSNTAY